MNLTQRYVRILGIWLSSCAPIFAGVFCPSIHSNRKRPYVIQYILDSSKVECTCVLYNLFSNTVVANFPQTRDFFQMEQQLRALAKQDPN
jgi:hypothetical protein